MNQLRVPDADDGFQEELAPRGGLSQEIVSGWLALSLGAAVLNVGLGPALRGTYLGLDSFLSGFDHVSAASGFAAAFLATFIGILGITNLFRTGTPRGLAIIAGLGLVLPYFIVFAAARDILPSFFPLASLLATTLSVSCIAFLSLKEKSGTREALLLTAAALFAESALRLTGDEAPLGTHEGLTLSWGLVQLTHATRILYVVGAALAFLRAGAYGAVGFVGVFALGLVGGGAAALSSFPSTTGTLLLAARTLEELGSGSIPFLPLPCLFLTALGLLRKRRSLAIQGALGFWLILPTSPLSLAALCSTVLMLWKAAEK